MNLCTFNFLLFSIARRRQCLLEVLDQIFSIFQTDRDPDQVVSDPKLVPHVLRDGQVRHEARALDEALEPAEALGQGEDLDRLQKLARLVAPAPDVERDHAREAEHLPLGELVLRVGRETGVEDLLDERVGREELGDGHGALGVLLHADGQRADAAGHQVAVERARDDSCGTLIILPQYALSN